MNIVYTPQAREDLREIKQYISNNLQNPIAAKNVTDGIIKSIHRLSLMQNLGVELSEKTGRETDYRCLFSGNYGIFYIAFDDAVRIYRILDLRTDYMRIILSE